MHSEAYYSPYEKGRMMSCHLGRRAAWYGLASSIVLNAGHAFAQEDAASAISAGDTAWVLISSAIVLMMTAPGLALFYGGLVRRKNGLATIMQLSLIHI